MENIRVFSRFFPVVQSSHLAAEEKHCIELLVYTTQSGETRLRLVDRDTEPKQFTVLM